MVFLFLFFSNGINFDGVGLLWLLLEAGFLRGCILGILLQGTVKKQPTLVENYHMQELIDKLKAQGLTEDQAYKAIDVIKDFAKEKFPIFAGAINKLFDKYGSKEEEDFMP